MNPAVKRIPSLFFNTEQSILNRYTLLTIPETILHLLLPIQYHIIYLGSHFSKTTQWMSTNFFLMKIKTL